MDATKTQEHESVKATTQICPFYTHHLQKVLNEMLMDPKTKKRKKNGEKIDFKTFLTSSVKLM